MSRRVRDPTGPDVRFVTPNPAQNAVFSEGLPPATHGAAIALRPCVMSSLRVQSRRSLRPAAPRRRSGVHRLAEFAHLDEFAGLDRLDREELDEDTEPTTDSTRRVA